MTLKNAVEKIFSPQFSKSGFILTEKSPRFYCFNKNDQISILITVPPFCPPLLFMEYQQKMEDNMEGIIGRKTHGFVTFSFSYKVCDDTYDNIPSYAFTPSMGIIGDFVYYNSEDLEQKSYVAANEIASTIIPYIERLSARYIDYDEICKWENVFEQESEYYEQKAIARFHLPFDYKSGYREIEPSLFSLRGDNETKWKENFCDNLDIIIGLAAYLGKCIDQYSLSTEWYWEDIPEIITSTRVYEAYRKLHLRAICKNNREEDFELLDVMRNLWNYYPCIKCEQVEGIIGKIKALCE